jgi:TDG/mug DNA glycosylase family protein
MQPPFRPNRDTLLAAHGKTIPDVIAPGLRVLFCGINPSLYSAAIGHHFGRPGNRFWPTLHQAGFTELLLTGWEDRELLKTGYGVTNLVARATAAADELTSDELQSGARTLVRKVSRLEPKIVAILGIGAYRLAFGKPKATLGQQSDRLADSVLWVLPNPSGLNAHYQLADLVLQFRELKVAAVASEIKKGPPPRHAARRDTS